MIPAGFSTIDQAVFAHLHAAKTAVESCKAEYRRPDQRDSEIINRCEDALQQATECAEARRYFQFWRLIHEIEEDLIDILPVRALAARAQEIREYFRLNIGEGPSQPQWVDLQKAVDRIQKRGAHHNWLRNRGSPSRLLRSERNVLRSALNAVNSKTDESFAQYGFNLDVHLLSAVLVSLLGLVVAIAVVWHRPATPVWFQQLEAVCLGGIGAATANTLSSRALQVSGGSYARQVWTQVAARAVTGAVSGYVICMVLYTHLLTNNFPPWDMAYPGAFYAVVAFASGFLADRLLVATLDKVMQRLFVLSDRTLPNPPASA